jgi:hypothetical protein
MLHEVSDTSHKGGTNTMFKTQAAEPVTPWTGQKWEYTKIKKMSDDLVELNRLGQEGWELVGYAGSGRAATLKRPLPRLS